jgi:hypothetical protein
MTQRDSGFFQHSSNAHGELLFAVMATPEKPFVALTGRKIFHLINLFWIGKFISVNPSSSMADLHFCV